MKAVGYKNPGPIEAQNLQDIEIETPTAQGRDLLVEIKVVSA